MKHTPGKWSVHWNAKDSAEIHGQKYEVALLNGYVSEEELKANAQLIAAAPKLLEELRRALYCIYLLTDNDTAEVTKLNIANVAKEKGQAVIARATQESE